MYMTTHPRFKTKLISLLQSGEYSLRLKAYEIIEAVTTYYCSICS